MKSLEKNNMKNAVSLFLLLIMQTLFSQSFTRKDSLQGGLRPERNCFDVTHYTIDLKIDIKNMRDWGNVY